MQNSLIRKEFITKMKVIKIDLQVDTEKYKV